MIVLHLSAWQIAILTAMAVFFLAVIWRGFGQILKERDDLEKEVARLTQQNETLTTACKRLENSKKQG